MLEKLRAYPLAAPDGSSSRKVFFFVFNLCKRTANYNCVWREINVHYENYDFHFLILFFFCEIMMLNKNKPYFITEVKMFCTKIKDQKHSRLKTIWLNFFQCDVNAVPSININSFNRFKKRRRRQMSSAKRCQVSGVRSRAGLQLGEVMHVSSPQNSHLTPSPKHHSLS